MSEIIFNIEDVILEHMEIVHASVESGISSNPSIECPFNISWGFEGAMSKEQERVKIAVVVTVQAEGPDETNMDLKGEFTIDFVFKVPGLERYITREEDQQLYLATDVMVPLANISYSTARGIIYTRCQGTALKKVILPILPNSRLADMLTNPR